MFNLLRSEAYKLKHNKIFWGLLMLAVIVSSLTVLVYFLIAGDSLSVNMTTPTNLSGQNSIYDLTLTRFSVMIIIISLLATNIINSEFLNGTIKPIAINKPRILIYASKVMVLALAAAIFMTTNWLTSLLLSSVAFGWGGSFAFSDLYPLMRYFILSLLTSLSIASIIVCICILIRSSVGTVGISLGFILIMSFLEDFFSINESLAPLARYFPTRVSLDISTPELLSGDIVRMLLVMGVIIIICNLLGYFKFKKLDIK